MKVKSIFLLKYCNLCLSCKFPKGISSCGDTCIGEIVRSVDES